MKSQSLSQVQLFITKRPRLEKNIEKNYADSQDTDTVIQYVVAVLIRHALCISDFSLFCQDLVKEILLFAEPTEVLQKLAPLFRDYFENGKEWEQVTHRLYKKSKIYHRYNNRVSECKKYLFAKTTPVEELNGQQYKLVSTFEDAVGKIHTWSLRDADPNASAMKISAVLELMSSLTIFKKDGIRRFVQLENSEIHNCTRYIKIKKGEIVEESGPILTSQEVVGAVDDSAMQLSSEIASLSEEERLALVEMLLPEGVVLADTRLKEPAIIMSEKEASNEGSIASENAVAASQETVPTEGKETPTVKETPNAVETPVAEKTPTQSDHKKSNSEKQEVVEEKQEPQKKKKKGEKGKNNSKKGKGKDRKRRRRK